MCCPGGGTGSRLGSGVWPVSWGSWECQMAPSPCSLHTPAPGSSLQRGDETPVDRIHLHLGLLSKATKSPFFLVIKNSFCENAKDFCIYITILDTLWLDTWLIELVVANRQPAYLLESSMSSLLERPWGWPRRIWRMPKRKQPCNCIPGHGHPISKHLFKSKTLCSMLVWHDCCFLCMTNVQCNFHYYEEYDA